MRQSCFQAGAITNSDFLVITHSHCNKSCALKSMASKRVHTKQYVGVFSTNSLAI